MAIACFVHSRVAKISGDGRRTQECISFQVYPRCNETRWGDCCALLLLGWEDLRVTFEKKNYRKTMQCANTLNQINPTVLTRETRKVISQFFGMGRLGDFGLGNLSARFRYYWKKAAHWRLVPPHAIDFHSQKYCSYYFRHYGDRARIKGRKMSF